MRRAEQLTDMYSRFADNYTRFSELNDALLVDCSAEEWQTLLNRRSEVQRNILTENEEILKEARELMSTPIEDKEEADEILVYFRRLVNTRISDYCLLDIVYKPLLEFYEKTDDYLRLIGLNVSVGAHVLETFCSIDPSLSPINGKECCERAIECSKKVSPLKQPDVWISVFSAYANMLGSVNSHYPENRKEFFKYYDEALAYFDDPDIGPVLMSQTNGPMFKSLVSGRVLYATEAYECMSDSDRERFRNIIREQIKSLPEEYSPGETSVLKYFLSYKIGDTDPHSAFESLLADYYRLGASNYEIKDIVIKTEDYLARYYILLSLLELLECKEFFDEERERYVKEVTRNVLELAHSVPYGYMTSYVNYTCTSLCLGVLPLLNNPEEIKNVVNSLLIVRQPITYIHSLMVKEISVTIAEEMLKKKPELFIPLFGDTAEEVISRHDEIIAFISDAALYHDVGKSKVADIINNQYRRITDLEFSLIKLHTLRGPKVMLHTEYFEPYYDVMLGHHKTYAGKGGYPAEFDNTASIYRIIIDLITIADCTDAATDILGRNYARGKNFYDLLAELSAGKGSRYNPDIVSLIEESGELCEKLNRLTGEDRRKIYYSAYRDVMNLNNSEKKQNYFVEGLQGAGKSTMVKLLSEQLPEYEVFREGDYSPVELAWCAYVTEGQYQDILARYPSLENEIAGRTIAEGDHKVICYTKILTDIMGFHKDLEQYEIYNGNLDKTAFEKVIFERYEKWNGQGRIFECSIFQNIIENQMLYLMMSDEEILDFYRRMKKILHGKQFKIIYIDVDDIRGTIELIKKERSDENGNELWFPLMVRYIEESPYGKEHKLHGMEGLLSHLTRRRALEHRIIDEIFKDETVVVKSKNYDLRQLHLI